MLSTSNLQASQTLRRHTNCSIIIVAAQVLKWLSCRRKVCRGNMLGPSSSAFRRDNKTALLLLLLPYPTALFSPLPTSKESLVGRHTMTQRVVYPGDFVFLPACDSRRSRLEVRLVSRRVHPMWSAVPLTTNGSPADSASVCSEPKLH